MGLDESRMDRRSCGINRAPSRVERGKVLISTDVKDRVARYGHGAIGQHRPRIVHGDYVGVADKEVNVGHIWRTSKVHLYNG